MARPTASFQLYSQQFGRALRLMLSEQQNITWNERTDAQRLLEIAASVKPKAIIIDHVENYVRHGLPDVPREYDLERRKRRKRKINDAIPLRYCVNPDCLEAYEITKSVCPVCGTPRPAPQSRGSPVEVDGNCLELDPEVLHEMRKKQAEVDGPAPIMSGSEDVVRRSVWKRHHERQEAQRYLRQAMGLWSGWQVAEGRDQAEIQRIFFYKFGRDCMTAQTLGATEAEELRGRIQTELDAHNIVEAVKHDQVRVA
jgi:hypothetical protein